MDLTDIREKELLSDWAKENGEPGIFEMVAGQDSYYIDRADDDKEILEYNPECISDFIKQFQNIWKKENDEKVMKIIAMATIKARQQEIEPESAEKESSSRIPEYIYAL